MSEPFAALAQVTIERGALIRYLDARPRSAAQWKDWPRIGGQWYGFSWTADLPNLLARVDEWLGASYRHTVRKVLAFSEAPALGRCTYDEATQRFTFGTLTFSENLNDLVLFFVVARGLAGYMRDRESGFALVHNHLWANGDRTVAVMGLGADDHSHFLDAAVDAPAWERHVRDGKAVFDDIYKGYAALGRLDVFDKVSKPGDHQAGPDAADELDRLR
ncbi:hypothetical protein JQ596_34765 [Bradyrhizobium manausense]|uniref:hypothetical protein n=1 Tax=Bradyrhizobium TaxID=374 RepID=UPI001BA4EB05|nr:MULTISPECIES: hypothetical protein [Bradyrhizobium]MBR0830682.1 hypothetical protein [Bradyrhizobium manausense]UVO31061.1 hypothetical protein KUF59_10650 [Bradyrhizobium arachidis]